MRPPVALAWAVLLLMWHVGGAHAATMRLSVGQHEGQKDAEVQVPVLVTASPGMGAGHVELVYDATVLQALSADAGAMLEGKALFESNVDTAGRVVMGFASSGAVDGDGPLAVVTFKVVGAQDATSKLSLEAVEAWRADNELDILIDTNDGSFKITGVNMEMVLIALIVVLVLLVMLFIRVIAKMRRSG